MKLTLALLLLIPSLSNASNFARRQSLADDQLDAMLKAQEEAASKDSDETTARYLARSLGVPRSQLAKNSDGTWSTKDGEVMCGVVSGLGRMQWQCLDAAGAPAWRRNR